jgi:hypothetical protein
MANQRGSAIIVVLLFLGVVSLIGSGLLLQSKLDNRFTTAVKNSDRMLGLGESAASKSFLNLPPRKSVSYSGDPVRVEDPNAKEEEVPGIGTYDYRAVLVDRALAGECPGYEIATGESYQGTTVSTYYWIAIGAGQTVGGIDAQTIVNMGCVHCSKD